MIIGEEFVVKIEKMLNDGNAIARINNIPVFIKGACPNDTVKVEINKINKNYVSACIKEIVEKSPSRISPFCSLHNVCGSCSWQYIDYDEQLKQKQQIVEETLEKIAGLKINVNTIIPSPKIKNCRCKIQLPVSQTKVSKRLLSGYYKINSHELINIKNCPMQPEIINEINEFIKEQALNLTISGYNEKFHTGLIRHIIYRISSDLNQILIVFVINSNMIDDKLKKLSDVLTDKYPSVKGICANYNTKRTNVIMSQNTKIIKGQDFYIETLGQKHYKISANSFFQVNPACAVKIFDKVKELISSKIKTPSILDAYSGVSSFGIWLSDTASKVVCIEEIKSASSDAEYNKILNNALNVEIINGDTAIAFKKLINKNIKFDVSVIDPPRKGCSEEALNYLVKLTLKYIVYVSCNPATLARDIKILNLKGFKAVYVQPADMFPHTYHVETIVLFEKT